MGAWLYKVNNEGQLRWLGPEKGVIGKLLYPYIKVRGCL